LADFEATLAAMDAVGGFVLASFESGRNPETVFGHEVLGCGSRILRSGFYS